MTASKKILALLLLCGLSVAASADVLILKDGQAVSGRFQGGDPGGITFLVNGEYRRYQLSEIQSITILPSSTTTSTGSASSTSASSTAPSYSSGRSTPTATTTTTTNPAPYPATTTSSGGYSTGSSGGSSSGGYTTSPAPANTSSSSMGVTVPSGTILTVRMIDPVDSSINRTGEMFRATLDEPLMVNGRTIASRGTPVTTKLINVEEAGRMTGRSELALVLYDISINGRRHEITTEQTTQQGSSRGTQTATRVGTGAVIGTIIGAIAGGGSGAAKGAAAGAGAGAAVQIFTHGENVQVPAESRLEFTLASPLAL